MLGFQEVNPWTLHSAACLPFHLGQDIHDLFWPYTNTERNYIASHICNPIISLQGASNKCIDVFLILLQHPLLYSEVLYKFHYFSHIRGHGNSQCYWTGWCFLNWLSCGPSMSHLYQLPETALQIASQTRESLSQVCFLVVLSNTSKLGNSSLWFSVSLCISLPLSENSVQHIGSYFPHLTNSSLIHNLLSFLLDVRSFFCT